MLPASLLATAAETIEQGLHDSLRLLTAAFVTSVTRQ
jgi:hypothetical protein